MERPNSTLTTWRKSTYSGSGGGDCVEVGGARAAVLVRDTKDRGGAVLNMGSGAWQTFTSAVKAWA